MFFRTKDFPVLIKFVRHNQRIITESIRLIFKFKMFNKSHIKDCTKVICTLLDFNIISNDLLKLILEAKETFTKMDAVEEVAFLCSYIVRRCYI